MFQELLDKNLVAFYDEAADWKDAIKLSCCKLIEEEYCTGEYVDQVISCVEQLGPYIVLIPGLAMPHSTMNAKGVIKSGIAFTQFEKPVVFDGFEDYETKEAVSFFTLCAENPDEHMENMRKLFTVLSDEQILQRVFNARSAEELLEIDKDIIIEEAEEI